MLPDAKEVRICCREKSTCASCSSALASYGVDNRFLTRKYAQFDGLLAPRSMSNSHILDEQGSYIPRLELHRQPSQSLFNSSDEARYFEVFQTKASSELAGFFDVEIWSHLVPQISHAESFARHALIALGALYKHLHRKRSVEKKHHDFALWHYGRALRVMRESVGTLDGIRKGDDYSLRNALFGCLLTLCFES